MTGRLELRELEISLGPRRLVSLDIVVRPGEIVTIMGPSGSGKSTLLGALTGTLSRDFSVSGRILLNGNDITHMETRRRGVGLLFQDAVLFPHLSVGGNLGFALPAAIRPRAARQARIEAALVSAGLAGFADRDPATLSGGQKARVVLMRTLLAEPRALLLDEPFGRLDADLRAQIRQFTFERAVSESLPTLLVTHDPEDARATGGPVLSPLGESVPV